MKNIAIFALACFGLMLSACAQVHVIPNIVQEDVSAIGIYDKTNPDGTIGGGLGWGHQGLSLVPALNDAGTPVFTIGKCAEQQPLSALVTTNSNVNNTASAASGLSALLSATTLVATGAAAVNVTDANKIDSAKGLVAGVSQAEDETGCAQPPVPASAAKPAS